MSKDKEKVVTWKIPPEVHRRVKVKAAMQDKSMNQVAVEILDEATKDVPTQ